MSKAIYAELLLLLSFVVAWADSPPVIELKRGMNEVTIRVLNNSPLDFESVSAVVSQDDLPEGFTIFKNARRLNVSAKSKTEEGLLLRIEVDEDAKPGIYEIPFVLKDKENHSWNYKLRAKLEIEKPKKYELLPNYPNPFNAETQISYALANQQPQETQVVIYDLLGKQILKLVNKKQPAGTYKVIWDGKDEHGNPVASAIYFCRITSGAFARIQKMTLLR